MNIFKKWIHNLEEHRLDNHMEQAEHAVKGWPHPTTKEFRRKEARRFRGVNYTK